MSVASVPGMANAPTHRVILLGALDRTPASDAVVHTATSQAAMIAGAELHFLHIVAKGLTPLPERLEDARTFLDRVTNEAAARIGGAVAGHVAVGAPRQQILQLASDLEADLIVVGAHRKSTAGRWLLGSVSQAIVADAACPVLVARPKEYVHGPEIQPPCPDCLEAQRASRGATLWCSRHATRHVHGRVHHGAEVPSIGGGTAFIRT